MHFFFGRKLVIATKHHKETVIAPKAASQLGVLPFVPAGFDTDKFGTFSGEIERTSDPLSTGRKKCEMAMELTGVDLAIASEGSFGPHPGYFFIPGNEEIVMLIDKRNGFEIVGRKLSTETNFDGQLCTSQEELFDFANRVFFPSHGLILRDNQGSCKNIFKGICNNEVLVKTFRMLVDLYGHAFVETDMRAHYNPMRMKVIREATDAMIEKASVSCQRCDAPGFGITEVKSGLKCRQCGRPTRSPMAYMHSCSKCGFTREEAVAHQLLEDPTYCDYCNP